MTHDLTQLLSSNPYPGRGIVLGRSADGMHAFLAYFIMGRSANSRNRIFVQQDGALFTQAADPAQMEDASLIIYAPVRPFMESLIVSNGDQTDTILQHLQAGQSFEEALRTRTFEPDAPNYTPRISGLLNLCFDGFSYTLSILKSADGDAASVQRFFYEYPQPLPGQGHFIHTYTGDGDPLPAFCGEPVPVAMPGDLKAFGDGIWQALNADNKVSLYVHQLTLEGTGQSIIYNKYSKK